MVLNNISFLPYALAPNGGQLKELGQAAKKVVPYIDDVARGVVRNKSFLASIPAWLWVIIGIIVVAGAIYYFVEEN